MSGKLTVQEDLPPPVGIQSSLLPIADVFMTLMLSRPPGGSLRRARVSLATIWLSVGVALVAAIPGLLLAGYAIARLQWPLMVLGVLTAGLGVGAGALAVFGIAQHNALAAYDRQRGL